MHSGSRRAYVHHRKCDVPNATDRLSIRMILDKDSVEVFINGGIKTMSMTIPTELSADGISFHSRGRSIMNVCKYDLIG
jgi:beta-fructofuranosidase